MAFETTETSKNWFEGEDQVYDMKMANYSFNAITKIIDSEAKYYNGDYSKIFLQGTSAGGMMSISLALLIP